MFTTNNKKRLWILVCAFALLAFCVSGVLTSAQSV
jgi:hypothetical protein